MSDPKRTRQDSPENSLIDFISNTGNMSKHLRKVYHYCIEATACGTEDLPQDICSSMVFLAELQEHVENIELSK